MCLKLKLYYFNIFFSIEVQVNKVLINIKLILKIKRHNNSKKRAKVVLIKNWHTINIMNSTWKILYKTWKVRS